MTSPTQSTVPAGPNRSLTRLKPRMSTNMSVTSQSRPLSRSGFDARLAGQLGCEELAEPDIGLESRLLLLNARSQAGGHAAGQQLHEQGLDLGDARAGVERVIEPAIAIKGTDHLAVAGEDGRGHDNLHAAQALGLLGCVVGALPEGRLVFADPAEHVLARTPAQIGAQVGE